MAAICKTCTQYCLGTCKHEHVIVYSRSRSTKTHPRVIKTCARINCVHKKAIVINPEDSGNSWSNRLHFRFVAFEMDLVRIYHGLGMAYKEILRTLATQHGMVMSLSTLKRMLRANRLRRREYDDLGHIIEFILNELQGSGRLHGYRWMYYKCIEHGLRVRKEDVRIILSAVDPESAQSRRRRRLRRRQYFSRGPNFIWHIDSYDKLKPYGICINGCIDGYSRKIIWLRAAFTNSDPCVVGGYYAEAIERMGGYPRLLRTDMGTENVVLRDMQVYLRRNDEDNRAGQSSFLTGESTANQRIESWWGVMRRQGIEHWIQMFSELKDEGLFTGDYLDKALIQLCFMGPIKVSRLMNAQ